MSESGTLGPPDLSGLLYEGTQPILRNLSVVSPRNFDSGSAKVQQLLQPHRTKHYFLLFVRSGSVTYTVDLKGITVGEGQVLFVQPHQIRVPPASKSGADFFKITFDDGCLGRLPRTNRFWLDPLSSPKISLETRAQERVWALLPLLEKAWDEGAGPADLVLAYLQAVLAEVEASYFAGVPTVSLDRTMEAFVRFKHLVEESFPHQPTVADLARALGQSETRLYTVVKKLSGLSPKEYLTKRTVVEAQRLLVYSQLSVKELARHLGFDDESYFSRLFKKEVGQSVSAFVASLEEKSITPEDSSLLTNAVGR
jgi:AraC family transcriptional activator of pobA